MEVDTYKVAGKITTVLYTSMVNDDIRSALFNHIVDHKDFRVWPASVTKHHCYEGGLLVHTAEVLVYSLRSSEGLRVDRDVLATAALFHDFAKIYDYARVDGVWRETPYRHLVRHVAGSHAHFVNTVGKSGLLTPDQVLNVEHCILSHHGQTQWGSPVEPSTIEATLLHNADMLSARYGRNRTEFTGSVL